MALFPNYLVTDSSSHSKLLVDIDLQQTIENSIKKPIKNSTGLYNF